jgi:hypothetical protein
MRVGEIVTGRRFGVGYLLLPLYILLDFGVWALALLDYPFKQGRNRW